MTRMMANTKTPRTRQSAGIGNVIKRLHYALDVILMCVRWCAAYQLSLRNLDEMMGERGIQVDHSSVHRWVIKLVRSLQKRISRMQTAHGRELAHGRNLCEGQGHNGSACSAPSARRLTRSISCCMPIATRSPLDVTSRRRLHGTVSPKRLPWTVRQPIWLRSRCSTPGGPHRSRSDRTGS
ncbi:hypothetical protein BN2475_140034 [Paraburkholderia ribeironis]|uniref:Transposase n=1 Tax=Paraburkholderia ribeironis TaxID=1247936 RepID=A0A1N7RSR7_9BURK|nr:hypothetical protein BN2475_140034 [Paraburkholderia ribeironis]